LRARATIWRSKGHHDPDDAVKTALLAAAFDIEAAEQTFSTLAAADPETMFTDRDAILAIIEGTRADCLPEALRAMAATLRTQGIPDDSGSTAAHLENAAKRISADAERLREILSAAAAATFDAERICEIARGPKDSEPAHDDLKMGM
jgi:hypothetical protein